MTYRIVLLCLLITKGLLAQHELSEFPDLAYLQPEAVEVDSLQRLNLVMPDGVDNPPILVWIGGGAWAHFGGTIDGRSEVFFSNTVIVGNEKAVKE